MTLQGLQGFAGTPLLPLLPQPVVLLSTMTRDGPSLLVMMLQDNKAVCQCHIYAFVCLSAWKSIASSSNECVQSKLQPH